MFPQYLNFIPRYLGLISRYLGLIPRYLGLVLGSLGFVALPFSTKVVVVVGELKVTSSQITKHLKSKNNN